MDPALQEEFEKLANASGGASLAFDTLSKIMRSGEPNWAAADRGLKMLGGQSLDSAKKIKTAGEKFTSGLASAVGVVKSGFRAIGQESESGAKAIKNITDSVGGAISGMLDQIPYAGKLLGGFAQAITGATGLALGFVDELETTNKKLGDTGIMLTGIKSGIDEFVRVTNEAQLSGSILNKVIDENINSLRLFSGGAAEGLKKVTIGFNLLKKANDGQYESLVKLGYSTEDIISGMADFGAAAKLAGKDLNAEQLAEGTTKYLKVQRELTRLTGVDLKTAKAKQAALQTDLAYQKMLKEVGADNAKALEELLSHTNESLQPLVKTLLTGGAVTDQQMALLQDALGSDFVEKIRSIGDEAREGIKLDPKIITEQFAQAQTEALKHVDDYIKDISAASIQTILNKGGPYADFLSALGPVRTDLLGISSAAQATDDPVQRVATGMGSVATALPEVEKASIALRAALFSIGTLLTTVMAPMLTGLAGMVSGGAGKLQESLAKSAEGINRAVAIQTTGNVGAGPQFDYATEEEKAQAVAKAISDTMGSVVSNDSMFKPMFTELGTVIKEAISGGFRDATDELLAGFGIETNRRKISNAQGLTSNLNIQPGTTLSMPDNYSRYNPIDQNSELYKNLHEYKDYPEELKKRGYEAIVTHPWWNLGAANYDFRKLPDSAQAPGNAFGNIINPTPGGQVIRVAEAGMPEIVAPASRGPGGKLGLEVSGAQLDNSRLLQTLAKTSENQVNVMAAVNSKMNDLVANMEKFARAQEQANRLAS